MLIAVSVCIFICLSMCLRIYLLSISIWIYLYPPVAIEIIYTFRSYLRANMQTIYSQIYLSLSFSFCCVFPLSLRYLSSYSVNRRHRCICIYLCPSSMQLNIYFSAKYYIFCLSFCELVSPLPKYSYTLCEQTAQMEGSRYGCRRNETKVAAVGSCSSWWQEVPTTTTWCSR